jgi:protein involved in polysaccharide export with SLBB domain
MKTKTLLVFVFAALCLAPRLFAQAALRPGDTVEIRLAGVPAEEIAMFSAPYVVDESGMLNLPYINQVRVAGLQPNQAQAAVEKELRDEGIYTHPTVTILAAVNTRFVSIGGAVRAPGRVPYTPDLTLMSTINAAGGFNEFADKKRVRLIRGGKAEVIDTRKISRDPSLDPKISPGDQIEVGQSWL